jgi:regulatory protein
VVDATLDELEGSGALAAARFTESFVRQRAARGQGPVRIRLELEERGVGPAQSAECLSSPDYDWLALARTTRAKRFGAARPKDFKERARQARFLQYRGFDAAQIHTALELDADSD